jgi:peptide/nickel transport system substrate-binding protein
MRGIQAGDEIAGWRVERKLGAGAMGEVFLARHPRLPRADVLKVIHPAAAADETFRRRFLREAEVVCGLEHPHVVAVRDRGEYNGRLYIAMQHIPGGDLRQRLDSGPPLSTTQVGQIASQVASALDTAHRRGLIHRDVKPENVLLMEMGDDEPYAFLADFGISRCNSDLTATGSVLTRAGDVLATPSYAAPELVQGQPLDGRADQYALACLVFEMLTKLVPFPRDTLLATFFAHVYDPAPSVCSLRPDLPAAADDVLARGLAKSPDDRYPSCADFAVDLRQALAGPTGRSAVRSPGRRPTGSSAPTGRGGGPALPPVGPGPGRVARPKPSGHRRSQVLLTSVAAVSVLAGLLVWQRTASDAKDAPPPPRGTPAATADPAVRRPSASRGGTLELVAPQDCQWDPQRAGADANCLNLQRLISRQLVTFAPGPGGTRLVPDLATSVPTAVDERTWRYTLKPGLRYEDGSPMTSADFKHGVERLAAPELGYQGRRYIIDELAGGKGYQGPYRDGHLASIETPDARTIVFHLARPFREWNHLMALAATTPVPVAKDTRDGYGKRPLASGPYRFARHRPNEELLLVRNDYWDRATDPARKALPDRVRLRVLPPSERARLLLSGEADADIGGILDPSVLTQVDRDPAFAARRVEAEGYGTHFLTVIPGSPALADVHCRRAVAWAVDRRGLQLSGSVGSGALATRLLPPKLSAGEPLDLFPSPDSGGNATRARAELAACGRPAGFTTKIAYFSVFSNAGVEAIVASLARVGITATPVATLAPDPADGFGLVLDAAGPDWPSAYGFFAPLVDDRDTRAQDGTDLGATRDRDVQADLDAGLTASTEKARRAAWLRLDRTVQERGYLIPLIVDRYATVHSSRLTNVYISEYLGDLDVTGLGVAP